jgi:uroporphyrinogen decarboxylase
MSLYRRERLRCVIQREPVDRLPTQINFTGEMGRKLAAHLGVSLQELSDRLDNHLLRVDLTYPRRFSEDGKVYYDWWNVGWHTETEGYWPAKSPLAEATSLDDFPWPDPNAGQLLNEAARIIARDRTDHMRSRQHFIAPNFGFCLFERAWSLRGFEAFLMDMVTNKVFAEELLERITEIQVAVAKRFVALGVDGGYFGDDYGAQRSLLFSPKTWRKLLKPRLARMFAVFRDAGLPTILHSDGDIAPILPDLVEIGLTTLNPVQPEVLDHHWLKQTFGDRLAFYGGVSTQTVLPYGKPDQVTSAVNHCVQTLAADNTGLMVAPSHRMTADIPMENVDALLSAFETLRGKS